MNTRRMWAGRSRRPKPRIYLHIGATKTGTTYLQGLMSANRDELAAAGCLYPGGGLAHQDRAVSDILWGGPDPRMAPLTSGQWDLLREEVLSHAGPCSVISRESLGVASAEQAERIVESLADAEVHVIITVRDAARTIPGQWQTACRNGKRFPFRRMIAAVAELADDTNAHTGTAVVNFQQTQGIPRMLATWVPLVGADRVHVITVPPTKSDPMLLWQRFAGVIGVEPAVCTKSPADSNPSLGHASTEIVRRVNKLLDDPHPLDYRRVVRSALVRGILAQRAGEEKGIALNRRGRNVANRWNRQVQQAIADHKVNLVGALDELPIVPADDHPKALLHPTDEELLAAAATAYAGALQVRADVEARATGTDAPTPAIGPIDADRWQGLEDPVASAVADVAAVVRDALDLHRRANAVKPSPAGR